MMRLRRTSRAVAALATTTLLASCASVQRVPPLPLQTAFTAELPFTVESAPLAIARGDTLVRCRVRRAVVPLSEVCGDTVFFSAVMSSVPARGQPSCSLEGPGIIALGGQAQVRSEIVRSDSVLTLFAVLAVVPVVVGLRVILRLMGR